MTETVGKEIMLEGVDPRELYGAQDVYLEQIKSLHPTLKIVARGQSLKVLGPEADTQRFAKRMEGLAAYYVKYGHVSAEVIEQCFAGGIAQDDAPVDKDVIVYGNNGTIVRARTVNQQRLVKLYDRNDLLFAGGPAGSGKTYTAIALAVRALKERQVRRIILTRPAVEAGEKLGFLPGDMKEKLDPYLQPLYDALNDMIPPAKLQKHLEEGTVQIAPLAYKRGRTLGFPTANLAIPDAQVMLPNGVYAATAHYGARDYAALANIGNNPTFPGCNRRIEVNIQDFSKDIYDRLLEVRFLQKIRDEEKFDSVATLVAQMHRDRERAKEIWRHCFTSA